MLRPADMGCRPVSAFAASQGTHRLDAQSGLFPPLCPPCLAGHSSHPRQRATPQDATHRVCFVCFFLFPRLCFGELCNSMEESISFRFIRTFVITFFTWYLPIKIQLQSISPKLVLIINFTVFAFYRLSLRYIKAVFLF